MRYLFLVVVLSGCAPRVIVHDYPNLGLRINQATKGRVEQECGRDAKACAYSKATPCEIWAYSADDLTHELGHCSGMDEESAQKENW